MMRIGIGGFAHETNTFSNIYVTPKLLATRWHEGERMVKENFGVHNYIGGFLDEAAAQPDVEYVPTVMATAAPSGMVQKETLEAIRDRIVELLCAAHEAKPLDAIALHLHGAAVADGYPDVEGEIIRTVRESFGPDMPIGVVLDLHGNITDAMMEHADLLIGVKTYPHVDEYDAARIMFSQLCDMVRKGYKPFKRLVRLPWVMTCSEGLTMSGPAHDVQQFCIACEKESDDLMQATFFQGFPYSDIKETGVSVLTMAKTQKAADAFANKIARYAWDKRHEFTVPVYGAEEAMDIALAIEKSDKPVVINESSDNCGGGAPGDGTFLLREMLKRNVEGSYFGFIYDPEAALQAAKAGVGNTVSLKLGGKMDNLHGEPIELTDAYVKCVSDGVYINHSPKGFGDRYNMGPSACLVVGNVHIVVSSARRQPKDDGVFRMVGLSYEEMDVVALKSSQHFKAWWQDKSRGMIPCDSPGINSSDLRSFNFKNLNLSYYPLEDSVWEEE